VKIDKKTYSKDEQIVVSANVSNTGNFDGAEVVQVYVGKPKSSVKRAIKELKGFQKISMQKGAVEAVEISININDLVFYDESISDWNLEKGVYVIYVGNAANNISKEIKMNIN